MAAFCQCDRFLTSIPTREKERRWSCFVCHLEARSADNHQTAPYWFKTKHFKHNITTKIFSSWGDCGSRVVSNLVSVKYMRSLNPVLFSTPFYLFPLMWKSDFCYLFLFCYVFLIKLSPTSFYVLTDVHLKFLTLQNQPENDRKTAN